MNTEIIFEAVKYLGIVAFSISGTLTAVKKKADIVGGIVFALLTSFGGGILRDLTLGINPPHAFVDVDFFRMEIVCVAVSLFIYSLFYLPKAASFIHLHEHDYLLDISDALGLALFCVLGVEVAFARGMTHPIIAGFCGCITGVGGGILRDVVSAEVPSIFRKRIYLIPAVLGSLCYVWISPLMANEWALLISSSLIITIRILAMVFKWNIPPPKTN